MEDVDLMRTRGESRRTLFFIDSSDRDDSPTGGISDYSITLEEPMRNVVSIDVIDSMIPSTEYSVEPHNNTMRLFVTGHEPDLPGRVQAHSAEYLAWFLQLAPDTAWGDQESDADCELLVLDHRAPDGDVPGPEASDDSDTYALTVVPVGRGRDGWTRVTDSGGEELRISVARVRQGGPAMTVSKRVYHLPIGNFSTASKFVRAVQTGDGTVRSAALTTTGIPFLVPASDAVEQLGKMAIDVETWASAMGTSTAVVLYDTTSTASRTLGFHRPVAAVEAWGRALSTNMVAGEPVDLFVGSSLMLLAGESYLTLRCRQVEHSAYAGTGKRIQRGIGKFKLGAPGAIRADRVEFISTLPHTFAPIARIDRLSLRFERGSDGRLYDFKGVDHMLVLAVTTIVPRLLDHTLNPMNPEYNPDFRAYMVDRLQEVAREEAAQTDSEPMDAERLAHAIREHTAGMLRARGRLEY